MLKNCQLCIQAAHIVTQNPTRTILENACILIDKGKIVAIDNWEKLKTIWNPHKKIDLDNSLILPGLINAHTHISMTYLRGLADDMPLMEWLNTSIFPVEKHLNAEIVYMGALLGCAEMLSSGTTTYKDMYLFEEAVFAAAHKAKIRMFGGEVIFNFPSASCPTYQDALKQTTFLHQKYKGNSKLNVIVTPHSIYTSNAEILTQCKELAQDLNAILHLHLAENSEETSQCIQQFGKSPVQYCYDLGLLTEKTTLAHVVDVNDEDLLLIKKSKASVIHNVSSNMKLASGIAPIPQMLEMGINVCLGTDGAASNNRLNMFTEMGRCALLHKVVHKKPSIMPCQTVLDMATLNAAKALQLNNIGSLHIGAHADLIALNLNSPNLQPLYEPISQIVYAATGLEVHLTMVDGEILYQDGKFLTIDYENILKEMASISQWVRSKVSK